MINTLKAPDRVLPPRLSSISNSLLVSTLLTTLCLFTTSACAQPAPLATALATSNTGGGLASVSTALYDWKTLQQSDTLPFSLYANFLTNYAGWPGEAGFRKNAERSLKTGTESPDQVIAYFRKLPALTPTGNLRFAEALFARGFRDEAKAAVRKAWIGGALTPEDESIILNSFADSISPGDHDLRMDRLLWDRATDRKSVV